MEVKSKTPIILCGGDINYSHLPIGTNRSNAMIPVNGKPVIGWILDNLEIKGFREAVVVLQFDNRKLSNYLGWAYADRMDIHYAYVQPNGAILHSLLAGLSWIQPGKGVLIVLGDTLVEDALPEVNDYVFTGHYDEPENWCLAEINEARNIQAFYDKQNIEGPNLEALAGVYALSRVDVLRSVIIRQIQQQHRELCSALDIYNQQIALKAIPATSWYDFGHISGFNRAKRNLLQSRYFNSLTIDPVEGVITKISRKTEKLEDELNWYDQLPEPLQIFTPKLLKKNTDSDQVRITQEYYGYPNLAELFVFGDLNVAVWKYTLDQLILVHQRFNAYRYSLSGQCIREMYWNKTCERLAELVKEPGWADLFESDWIEVNGVELKNWPLLKEDIAMLVEEMTENVAGSVIHGDYCFSNILYDVNNQIVRLIDPRGSFGEKGIYGDPRYDMAKLRHSVHGLYDFIVADLFRLDEPKPGQFVFEINSPEKQLDLIRHFDQLTEAAGYSRSEIRLIEALLFLSMTPYHKGHPRRQKAMFLNGILFLNQLLQDENRNRPGWNHLQNQTAGAVV
ncbi:MAG: NTP transferase domain-containing protein [Saprospiraceae bacterium]